MKQILIVLILCLTQILPANSQTLSKTDSTCCVPCLTLKHALILKADHKLLQAEIGVVRDSVNLILSASTEKDSIIHEKDQIIVSQSKIIGLKDQVITTQEKENSDLKKNIKHYKKQRNIAYVGSGGLFILSLLLLL